jgi:hypothetical protein
LFVRISIEAGCAGALTPNAALTKSPYPKETGNMAAFDVTKKLQIYHTLYRLNLSFAAIVRHCGTLEETRFFRSRFLRDFQGYAQELQAEMNQELLEILHGAELDDWSRYGKVRQAREKELRDPDDVFIHAEERRKELAKKRKKARR